ncbi:MAG: TolC family protein [Sedimentisphaerales bacterium]|nr:TolC family protein [Sedimentisphaerales bacterium]
MNNKFQPVSLVFFTILFVAGLIGGCKSPAELVNEADSDSYAIIEEKWDPNFGEMANYKIRDSVATYEEISEMIPPSGILTLQNAVEIATEYSRAYQSQKESLYTSALSLTSTRHQYESQLFGTFDAQYRNPPGDDSGTVSSSGGIDKAFVTAGGVIANIGLSVDWTRFLTDDPYTTLGSILNASITAPLLGNVAGIQAWESLTQAERNMLYQVRNFNRYRQTFVVSIINEYYRVLQAEERLKIARASYERQLRTVERTQMEVDVKQRPQADADRIRQDLLNAENSIISNEQSYKQTLDSFKVTLSLPADANITLDPNELLALEELGVSEPEYSLDEAIEMAMNLRLDLANTKDRLDDTRRSLVLAEKGIGVQMDLRASSNVTSPSGETDFDELQFHNGTYTVGVGADLPFDQVSERNNYRRALISMQQSLRSYDEDLERVKLDVRQAYRNLVESTQSYEIQKIGVKLAERRVDEQKIRLELSLATIIDLQDSEDALVTAQNNYMNAIINYLNAKLSFYRDIGTLEVKPDGMWEQSR